MKYKTMRRAIFNPPHNFQALTVAQILIYYIPLQPPTIMTEEIKSNAMNLGPALGDAAIKHPLLCSALHEYVTTYDTTTSRRDSAARSLLPRWSPHPMKI